MEVQTTFNYARFKFIKGNRLVDKGHVKRIKQSMSKQLLIEPIKVNENDEIIDGQHRFTAAKELGLPIHYYVDATCGIDAVQAHNTISKKWENKDFLNLYCVKGYSHYIAFAAFQQERKEFDISVLLVIAQNAAFGGGYTALFREGRFIFSDIERAKTTVERLRDFKDFAKYNEMRFVSAFVTLSSHAQYNHDRMAHKMERFGKFLQGCANRPQYLTALNEIYNYKVAAKDKIDLSQ